jgi:hypothetical protein
MTTPPWRRSRRHGARRPHRPPATTRRATSPKSRARSRNRCPPRWHLRARIRTPPVSGEGAVALAADEPLPGDAPSSILVRFEPGSASLPPDAGSLLGRVLATAKAQGAVIRIEGAAEAPALALDRARAVALGLMRLGARARDLEMGLAPAMTGDRARVLLAGPVAR